MPSGDHCCVPKSSSDGRSAKGILFHHFPRDERLQRQWIIAVRRDVGPEFKTTDSTVVCSDHFVESDYVHGVKKPLAKLAPDAVPRRFEWTVEKARKPP